MCDSVPNLEILRVIRPGAITLRPLSRTGLCLTAPGAMCVSGRQLTVQPCDGKADQEFVRMPNSFSDESAQELIPFADGRLCVGTPKGVKAGAPVALVNCAPKPAPTWDPMEAWYQWGGVAPSLYTYQPVIPPAAALTVGSITSTGGGRCEPSAGAWRRGGSTTSRSVVLAQFSLRGQLGPIPYGVRRDPRPRRAGWWDSVRLNDCLACAYYESENLPCPADKSLALGDEPGQSCHKWSRPVGGVYTNWRMTEVC